MNVLNSFTPSVPSDVAVVGFLGCDGVGTTTHAAHASKFLQSQGFRTHDEWMRFDHRLSLPVLGMARLLGKTPEYSDENGNTLRAHNFEDSWLLSTAYKKTLPIDQRLMVHRKFESIPPSVDSIVSDRFILDALVDLVVSTKDMSLLQGSTAEKFWHLIPPQSDIIGLDCDPETIATRRPDVNPDPFLELRTKAYRRLFENDQITVVDTSQPLADAKNEITTILETNYGSA